MANTRAERLGNVTTCRIETAISEPAAPIFTKRIIKMIDGKSFSSPESAPVVPDAATFAVVLLSMLNGSTLGAGEEDDGVGAASFNQEGDADIFCL